MHGQRTSATGSGTDALHVVDQGQPLSFTFAAMMAYHGPGSPGGVAHAFKVMERAFPLLAPDRALERRELTVATAFGGPGARDGFELVTRAVTEQRYVLDPGLARPERGQTLERFVFRLGYRSSAVTLSVRAGFVPDELIELVRRQQLSATERSRLQALKQEMADRLIGVSATTAYDAELASLAPCAAPASGAGANP